jgi:hypothetical protein
MNDLLGVPRPEGDSGKKKPPKDEFNWASVEGGTDVKILTESNFEDELTAAGKTLVMYFAPCKNYKLY